MAYNVGDTVFVPSSLLPNGDALPFALYRTTVQDTQDRSIKVQLPGGAISDWMGSSKAHKSIGILILTIGDNSTERTLLDPLAKSLLQFCRLLLDDSYVWNIKVRSLAELRAVWQPVGAAYSHIFVIGHGDGAQIQFAVDGWVAAGDFADALQAPGDGKLLVSLTCKAGLKAFGGEISKAAICHSFIGPFHAVHGAVASQFAQSFLGYQLLAGETIKVAFKHARERVPLSSSFRLWRSGELTAGPKT